MNTHRQMTQSAIIAAGENVNVTPPPPPPPYQGLTARWAR